MHVSALIRSALLAAFLSSAAFTPLEAQRKAVGVARNSHGRIARSSKARTEFKKKSGYPHGRPGYVIDHIVPLSKGGSDSPSNMQWQTKAEARAKDHWERGRSSHTTYRSRSYSRKSYAPKHRAPRSSSPTRSYRSRTYRAPRTKSYSYHRSSHRRK